MRTCVRLRVCERERECAYLEGWCKSGVVVVPPLQLLLLVHLYRPYDTDETERGLRGDTETEQRY
ncbi:unnamed protein product, partial [Pleuronectes platessa]